MRDDSDAEKWRLKDHTSIKHNILESYLFPWFNKISEITDRILYIDGFAGRGRYTEGEPGSPLIAIDVFEERLEALPSKVEEVICVFIESNSKNYRNLEAEVEDRLEDCHQAISEDLHNEEFAEYSMEFFEHMEEEETIPIPAFIFVDPFGYSGLPFEVISNYITVRNSGLELFITCMTSEMARWMADPSHQKAITELLGTEEWLDEVPEDMSQEERASEFARIYQQQLMEEAGAEYVWLFEMSQSDQRRNGYYLFHVTNHFDGFRLMKDTMYGAGDGPNFRYLGPDHYPYMDSQLSLGEFGAEDRDAHLEDQLTNFLRLEFAGERLSFYDILKQTYHRTDAIEKHYRSACRNLERAGQAKIINRPEMGGTENGLSDRDEVEISKLTGFEF